MKNSIHIKVTKLFDANDIDLIFDKNLNIVAGENGCGKSTILKIIYFVIKNDFIALSKIPFETLEISIDQEKYYIEYKNLLQLEIAKTPEFRFVVLETLTKTSTFSDFIRVIEEKGHSIPKYNSKFNDGEYTFDTTKYILDDNQIYNITNYHRWFRDVNSIFGSIIYLNQVYNAYHKLNTKIITFKNIKEAFIYNFVDLDPDFYNLKSLNIFQRMVVINKLSKIMKNKKIKLKKSNLTFYSKRAKKQIEVEKLSSGEKKMCQFYKSINIVHKKSLLLLDEPELSLSYRWNSNLLNILKATSRKSKIIIATQQTQIIDERDLELFVPILQNYE